MHPCALGALRVVWGYAQGHHDPQVALPSPQASAAAGVCDRTRRRPWALRPPAHYEGRKTGEPRVTPLQYEQVNGEFVVGSVRGALADWYRNVAADPRVEVRVGRSRFSGVAETCSDPGRIADLLELRLERHPRMVGLMLRLRGVPVSPTRADLETYAAPLTMVTITPQRHSEHSRPYRHLWVPGPDARASL